MISIIPSPSQIWSTSPSPISLYPHPFTSNPSAPFCSSIFVNRCGSSPNWRAFLRIASTNWASVWAVASSLRRWQSVIKVPKVRAISATDLVSFCWAGPMTKITKRISANSGPKLVGALSRAKATRGLGTSSMGQLGGSWAKLAKNHRTRGRASSDPR